MKGVKSPSLNVGTSRTPDTLQCLAGSHSKKRNILTLAVSPSLSRITVDPLSYLSAHIFNQINILFSIIFLPVLLAQL